MSIENCPLSQIPTEIVAGGPSLVIQVYIVNRKKIFSVMVFFPSVSESARTLQNDVKRPKLTSTL